MGYKLINPFEEYISFADYAILFACKYVLGVNISACHFVIE